jgi:hypothetical protein
MGRMLIFGFWGRRILGLTFYGFRVLKVEFGEGFVGDGGKEFFEGGIAQINFREFGGGVAGLTFGFGFFGFAASHEFFGQVNLGDVFVEGGVIGAEKVEVFFFDLAQLFAGNAALFVFDSVGDIGTFNPLAEFELFLFRGVGLGKGEPVALDLEEIVGEGGTAEARDVVGELAEGGPFAVGVGFGVDVAGHGGVLKLGPEEELVDEMNARSVMGEGSLVERVAWCVVRDV